MRNWLSSSTSGTSNVSFRIDTGYGIIMARKYYFFWPSYRAKLAGDASVPNADGSISANAALFLFSAQRRDGGSRQSAGRRRHTRIIEPARRIAELVGKSKCSIFYQDGISFSPGLYFHSPRRASAAHGHMHDASGDEMNTANRAYTTRTLSFTPDGRISDYADGRSSHSASHFAHFISPREHVTGPASCASLSILTLDITTIRYQNSSYTHRFMRLCHNFISFRFHMRGNFPLRRSIRPSFK